MERLDRDKVDDLLEFYRQQFGLPDEVVGRAREIYEKAKEAGIMKGRSAFSVMAAAVYAACRELGFPLRLKDLRLDYTASLTWSTGSVMAGNAYRKLVSALGLAVKRPDPLAFLKLISERLQLSPEAYQAAEKLVEKAVAEGLHLRMKAPSLAAAAVYAVAAVREPLLEKASGVNRVTFRRHAEKLLALRMPERTGAPPGWWKGAQRQ